MDKRIKNKMILICICIIKQRKGMKHQLNCRYVYLRGCVGNVTHLAETWQQIHIRTRKLLVHL